VTLITPPSGKIFHRQGGTCYGRPYIKVPNLRFTRYGAMNDSAKCRKWGCLRWLWGTQGHRKCHHLIKCIRLPFDFNRNYVSIFTVFTARCYASAVLAMGLCPSLCLCLSVCLSQAGVLLKRQNVGSHKQHTIPQGL